MASAGQLTFNDVMKMFRDELLDLNDILNYIKLAPDESAATTSVVSSSEVDPPVPGYSQPAWQKPHQAPCPPALSSNCARMLREQPTYALICYLCHLGPSLCTLCNLSVVNAVCTDWLRQARMPPACSL